MRTFLPLLLLLPTLLSAKQISPIRTQNLQNSLNAPVLTDTLYRLGPSAPWKHATNQWQQSNYPWSARLDLLSPHTLSSLTYFSGGVPFPSTAKLTIDVSVDGTTYVPLTSATNPIYNAWNTVPLHGTHRFLRVRFTAVNEHFEITEIRVSGKSAQSATTAPPTTTISRRTARKTRTRSKRASWDPSTNLQAKPPPKKQQANGYRKWPNSHLSKTCRRLHDRYWTRGPHADPRINPSSVPRDVEYLAYHTWHSAIVKLPGGVICDFGHEHGNDPSKAGKDMFELFGGWPAFGYAAAKNGDMREEDHVGHKVTVARFGAAIGDGANTGSQLYDAGFECSWVSKVHQGSYSMDALKNHLHEYFLAVSCNDGPGGTAGTRLSVKFLYTFGRANEFNPMGCDPNPQSSKKVTGPGGRKVGKSKLTKPEPNEKVNGREFSCYDALGFQKPVDQQQVDLWTQPIRIERGNEGPVFLQPYYIVKNPARMLKDSKTMGYTMDLCRSPATAKPGFCDDVVPFNGVWNSAGTPFNGALRAINFKKVSLYNDNKPTNWCTDAFGRGGSGTLPCGANQIEQYANSFRNGWDRKTVNGRTGEVKGAWWTKDVCGNLRTAERMNAGYRAFGIGFEFVVDNRNPDDDCDGVPDGAALRGEN